MSEKTLDPGSGLRQGPPALKNRFEALYGQGAALAFPAPTVFFAPEVVK